MRLLADHDEEDVEKNDNIVHVCNHDLIETYLENKKQEKNHLKNKKVDFTPRLALYQ